MDEVIDSGLLNKILVYLHTKVSLENTMVEFEVWLSPLYELLKFKIYVNEAL